MQPGHRLTLRVGTIVAIAIGGVLLGEVIASVSTGHPLGWFTQDPAASYGGDAIAGIQSNLGVLALWSAATVLIFTWLVCRSQPLAAGGFLLIGALLSGVLALDDLLRLHDDLFERLTGRGERIIFLGYAIVVLVWLARYRAVIFRHEQVLLLLGMAFLGLAVGVDLLEHQMDRFLGEELRPFVEDGVKFVGFAFWSAGLSLHCYRVLSQRVLVSRDA